MTDQQFQDWLDWHYAAFPVVEQQLLKLSDDSMRNILKRWKMDLGGFGRERLERATEEMTRNRFDQISLTAHLSELRRLCNRYGAEARQEDRLPSLSEATPEQRAAASENLRQPMMVLAASAKMQRERADAGFFRKPIKFRKYWGGRINDAIRQVSKLLPDDQYAAAILSETRTVHEACMKELSYADPIRSSDRSETVSEAARNHGVCNRAAEPIAATVATSGVLSGVDPQRQSYCLPAMTASEAEQLAADAAAVDGDDCPF